MNSCCKAQQRNLLYLIPVVTVCFRSSKCQVVLVNLCDTRASAKWDIGPYINVSTVLSASPGVSSFFTFTLSVQPHLLKYCRQPWLATGQVYLPSVTTTIQAATSTIIAAPMQRVVMSSMITNLCSHLLSPWQPMHPMMNSGWYVSCFRGHSLHAD